MSTGTPVKEYKLKCKDILELTRRVRWTKHYWNPRQKKRAQQHLFLKQNGCLQLSRLMENIKIVLKQHHLEICRRNNTSLGSTLCNKRWCVVSLWLANVAAMTDKLFRAISIHISLNPPTITKTSRSIYTHIIRAKHFHQQFCQLPLPNSISRACSQVNILFQWPLT